MFILLLKSHNFCLSQLEMYLIINLILSASYFQEKIESTSN